MTIDLTQSEMNELVYALGIANLHGKMMRKEIAEQVSDKLYRVLALENERLEKVLEHDSLVHDMNFKRRYIQSGNYTDLDEDYRASLQQDEQRYENQNK